MMANSNREVQYESVTTCRFESKLGDDGQPTVASLGGALRLAPSKRWSAEEHFHEDLMAQKDKVICCQWQAMAHECLALVFSPDSPDYRRGRTYEVVLGALGNTRTTLRRGRNEKSVPSLVCQGDAWNSYWACLVLEEDYRKFYVGVGEVPGEQCVAILEDTVPKRKVVAEKKEAVSNEGEERKEEKEEIEAEEPKEELEDMQEDTYVRVEDPLCWYAGFGNRAVFDRQAPQPLQIRNIRLTSLPDLPALETISPEDIDIVHVGELTPDMQKMVDDYKQACAKAKARSEKFGVPYKEPSANVFMSWSQQRYLRANPKKGFQTGINLADEAEKAKQEARRQRFGTVAMEATATNEADEKPALPVNQAWDNESLVQKLRVDPPKSLWKVPPADAGDDMDEFRSSVPTSVPDKVHMFSIDWAAFKQIRTNDIMSYFSIYGPSYVEWLGDLSCNIHFEDQYSAARVLENMSTELPTPVPDDVPPPEKEDAPPRADLGAMGWRLGKRMLRKVKTDRFGQRGTTARLLMRVATSEDMLEERPSSWPKPPPGFSTKRVLGPGSDFPKRRGDGKRRRQEPAQTYDPSVPGSEHPLLGGSLSAGRDGFSVEEMEAERAQKRAKKADDEAAPEADA